MPRLRQTFAYVDESGCLPDPNDRYIAFAAIITSSSRTLRKVVKKASRKRKSVQLKRQSGREIKWANASDNIRVQILKSLTRQDIQVFWLVVDKEGRGVQDTPENYGLMFCELVQECLVYHPNLALFVDMHFNTQLQREAFDCYAQSKLNIVEQPTHIDSQQDGSIQLADFVAGAILYQFRGRSEFADLIEQKVVAGKVIKWRQLAKRK